jgi:hypothetical protein
MTENNPLPAIDVATLARSYNILEYAGSLREMLVHAYRGSNLNIYNKRDLHWLVSEILLEQYKGESTLKAKLVDLFIHQDVTAAFEIRVNKSRADFLTINGQSKSFEIKSELDNLQKLPKQISDYQAVFDFNYLVIDEKHYHKALQLIPARYGVMVLHQQKLTEDRAAMPNVRLNSLAQLKLFTKKEFAQTFKIPGTTPEEVFMNFDAAEINHWFKVMLKSRYMKRWQFLVNNRKKIHPIDYQFFFQHNIAPEIIYGVS